MDEAVTTRVLIASALDPETILPLETVKQHARVDTNDDDGLIAGYRDVAIQFLDAAGNGWLGRALGTQAWELRLTGFPGRASWGGDASRYGLRDSVIALPCPPVRTVDSIKYDDTSGAEQTLDPSAYKVIGGPDAGVLPAYGTFWPVAQAMPESVRIRFTAGYGSNDGELPLPAPILQAMLLMIGDMYEFRETATAEMRVTPTAIPMSATVDALLSPYRAFWR